MYPVSPHQHSDSDSDGEGGGISTGPLRAQKISGAGILEKALVLSALQLPARKESAHTLHFPQKHALSACIERQVPILHEAACDAIVRQFAGKSGSSADIESIRKKLQDAHPAEGSMVNKVIKAAKRCAFSELGPMRTFEPKPSSGPIATGEEVFKTILRVAERADALRGPMQHIDYPCCDMKFVGPQGRDMSALCESFSEQVKAQPISRRDLAQLADQTIKEMEFTARLHKQYSSPPPPKKPDAGTMHVVGDRQIAVEGRGNVVVSQTGSKITVNGKTYPKGTHRLSDGSVIVNGRD